MPSASGDSSMSDDSELEEEAPRPPTNQVSLDELFSHGLLGSEER